MIARLGFCLLTFVLIASASAKEEADMDLGDAVAANVYLDDIADFADMNGTYELYVGDTPPTRTTVQQAASDPGALEPDEEGRFGTLEQISIVAVRSSTP